MKLTRIIDPNLRDWTKITLHDGDTEVARLWAPTFEMRVGSAVVKTGGIAGVGTNDECRGKGCARIILGESTRYFTETGHDMALLFGIPNFYHKFGYAPVLPAVQFRVAVADAEAALPKNLSEEFSVHAMEPENFPAVIPDVLQIYNHQNGLRTGCFVRPDTWKGFRRGTDWSRTPPLGKLLVNETEEIVSYYVVDDVAGECRIAELGFTYPSDFEHLLAAITEEARQRKSETIKLVVPPDHPFTVACRTYCGGTAEVTYFRNREGMARIINLQSLFEKLCPELVNRLENTLFANTRGVIEIQTEIGTVVLKIDRSKVNIVDQADSQWRVIVPQHFLTQIVMGYRSIGEVALEDGVEVDPDCIELLDALFPTGMPWLPTPDWF